MPDKITVTYETIFDMLRSEKNKGNLQELPPTFFSDVTHYLSEKQEVIKSKQRQHATFGEESIEQELHELRNIRRLIRELCERRERKIIDMALNKSKTNAHIIVGEDLLTEEKKYYYDLLELFNHYRSEVIQPLVN